jgi:hypothetical protein
MTDKEKLVNVTLGHASILVIPVTHWDISDPYFAEITAIVSPGRPLSVSPNRDVPAIGAERAFDMSCL